MLLAKDVLNVRKLSEKQEGIYNKVLGVTEYKPPFYASVLSKIDNRVDLDILFLSFALNCLAIVLSVLTTFMLFPRQPIYVSGLNFIVGQCLLYWYFKANKNKPGIRKLLNKIYKN
jgi:hypothetical protein